MIPSSRREQKLADRAYFARRIDLLMERKNLRGPKCSKPIKPAGQLPLLSG
jgi:hypothetical protein